MPTLPLVHCFSIEPHPLSSNTNHLSRKKKNNNNNLESYYSSESDCDTERSNQLTDSISFQVRGVFGQIKKKKSQIIAAN